MLVTPIMHRLAVFTLKNLNVETRILLPDENTQTSEGLNYLPKVTQLVRIEPGLIPKLLTSNSGLFRWASSKPTSQVAYKDGNGKAPKAQARTAGGPLSSALPGLQEEGCSGQHPSAVAPGAPGPSPGHSGSPATGSHSRGSRRCS